MSLLEHDKKTLLRSARFPLIFIAILWVIMLAGSIYQLELATYGLYPLDFKGLRGILFAPFIHGSWKHLFNNTFPLFFLTWALKYFYRDIFVRVFILIFFMHTFWLWFFGREAFHIGASGIIYGLGTFIFVSGIIRKNTYLLAIALATAFLYGSMIWGIFPLVEEVSWEAHLTGMVAGLFLAFYYKDFGPLPNIGQWKHVSAVDDKEDDGENDQFPYWDTVDELSDEDKKLV